MGPLASEITFAKKKISSRSETALAQRKELQELKIFNRLKASASENAAERPGAVCGDAKAALFPTFKKS